MVCMSMQLQYENLVKSYYLLWTAFEPCYKSKSDKLPLNITYASSRVKPLPVEKGQGSWSHHASLQFPQVIFNMYLQLHVVIMHDTKFSIVVL